MLAGYMRVSSADDCQSVNLQRDALIAAGVDQRNLLIDKASGARGDRPGLKACLEYLKQGDALVVWKLDRLAAASSLHHWRSPGPGRRLPVIDRNDGHRHPARRSAVLSVRRTRPV